MAKNKRMTLNLLRNYGVKIERHEEVHDHEAEARKLCAFLVDCCPEGTVREFAKLAGANYESIFDVGNKTFYEHYKEMEMK